MGLDMYLSARLYTTKDWLAQEANAALVPVADKFLPPDGNLGAITIERDVAYWRKANQIHHWFVENIQNGNDNCGHYDVSIEQLKQLRHACYQVLQESTLVPGNVKNGATASPETGGKFVDNIECGEVVLNPEVADRLLPTKGGFFFGSTDYDQWYIADLKNTIEQLDRIFAWLEAHKIESKQRPGEYHHEVDFQYHSSW